jgi:hypothetical protein
MLYPMMMFGFFRNNQLRHFSNSAQLGIHWDAIVALSLSSQVAKDRGGSNTAPAALLKRRSDKRNLVPTPTPEIYSPVFTISSDVGHYSVYKIYFFVTVAFGIQQQLNYRPFRLVYGFFYFYYLFCFGGGSIRRRPHIIRQHVCFRFLVRLPSFSSVIAPV